MRRKCKVATAIRLRAVRVLGGQDGIITTSEFMVTEKIHVQYMYSTTTYSQTEK